MKFKVEVDCTPDEARQFMGLPDVKPMQEAMFAKMQAQMDEAAASFSPDTLMKSWLSMVPQSPDQMQQAMMAMFQGGFGTSLPKSGSD